MFRRVDRKSILEIGGVAAGTIRGQSLGVLSEIYESQIYIRAYLYALPLYSLSSEYAFITLRRPRYKRERSYWNAILVELWMSAKLVSRGW